MHHCPNKVRSKEITTEEDDLLPTGLIPIGANTSHDRRTSTATILPGIEFARQKETLLSFGSADDMHTLKRNGSRASANNQGVHQGSTCCHRLVCVLRARKRKVHQRCHNSYRDCARFHSRQTFKGRTHGTSLLRTYFEWALRTEENPDEQQISSPMCARTPRTSVAPILHQAFPHASFRFRLPLPICLTRSSTGLPHCAQIARCKKGALEASMGCRSPSHVELSRRCHHRHDRNKSGLRTCVRKHNVVLHKASLHGRKLQLGPAVDETYLEASDHAGPASRLKY